MKLEKDRNVCLKPINCFLSFKPISQEYGVNLESYNKFVSKQLIVVDTCLSGDMDYTYLKIKNRNNYLWFLNEAIDTNKKFN